MAGAPGFEPGNGGIKIPCLTTWLRPNAAAEHIGVGGSCPRIGARLTMWTDRAGGGGGPCDGTAARQRCAGPKFRNVIKSLCRDSAVVAWRAEGVSGTGPCAAPLCAALLEACTMRARTAVLALTFAAAFAVPALAQTTTPPATTTKPAATTPAPATPAPATPAPATTPPATTAPAKPPAASTGATSPAKPGAPPSAAETALHQRQAACGAEWRAAKAAGKIPAGQTWPKYWSACNTRLKAQGK